MELTADIKSKAIDGMELDYVLKNKVREEEFEQTVLEWLSKGDYTPNDIIENIITEQNIVIAPIYLFKHEYSGFCSASLGYGKWENYNAWDDFNKKMVTKSRWVIEWHPYSQPVHGKTTTLLYAGEEMDERIVQFIENMGWSADDLQKITIDSPYYNRLVNLFRYTKSDVWKNIGHARAQNEAINTIKSQLPSQLVQNLNVNADLVPIKSFAVAAPFWLYVYEYQKKNYFVIVDGNSPDRIDGIKPVNEFRRNLVIAIRWIGWLAAIFIEIKFTQSYDDIFEDSQSLISWALYTILIFGSTYFIVEILINKIKNKSKKEREQLLNMKRSKKRIGRS